jgi:putative protease
MPEHTLHPSQKIPELLAPAGSMNAFFAAVAAGADAVYLSGKQFGARKFARNFTDEEIAEAVGYAHARGVRVYVTVNTLVHDRELAPVAEYLVRLYATGVDAVLVQDPGVAALAREIVPGLVLHASTQLTIHNAEGVRWAHKQGFSRVVLARELSLNDVEAIARATADTGIGLEVFAHGALCYSYSGQCLLSSVLGGRSGNRGMCAQPCRMKYSLVTADVDKYGRPTDASEVPLQEKYLLSPKDLCTYREIPRLVNAPVASLKIEGRMKSPEYVAIVVSTYRRALDAAAADSFVPDKAAESDLVLAFNREFTRGHLFGDRHEKLMGRDRPDNRGLRIGTVTRYDRTARTVTISPDHPVSLSPGDGLLFTLQNHPAAAWGFALNSEPEVQKDGMIVLAVSRPALEGSQVFLTFSHALATRARQIGSPATSDLRHPVPVDMVASVAADGHLNLAGTIHPPGKEPVALENTSDLQLVPARSRPLPEETLAAQLTKTGGTPFGIANLELSYDGTLFIPVSEINRIRREFFIRAGEVLIASYRPLPKEVEAAKKRLAKFITEHPAPVSSTPQKTPEPQKRPLGIILYADSMDAVDAGTRAGAKTICFEPAGFPYPSGVDAESENARIEAAIRIALDTCRAHDARLIWKLPRITRQGEIDAIRSILPRLHTAGLRACMVENPGTALAVKEAVPGLALAGSWGLNVFNAETVRVFSREHFTLLQVSPELSGNEIAVLAREVHRQGDGPTLAVFAQGNLETMVTEDCLRAVAIKCRRTSGPCRNTRWLGIRDETGRLFPVRVDGACRSHIFNAAETCLIDAVPELVAAGVDAVTIDARGKTADYAREMVRAYREAIASAAQKPGAATRDTTSLRERVKAIALGGITAGHYTRGLKEG